MSAKLGFTAGLAVGLLAGSRAGRGLYDRSAAAATAVVNDPRVRRGTSTALHKAGSAGSAVAGAAARKVRRRGETEGEGEMGAESESGAEAEAGMDGGDGGAGRKGKGRKGGTAAREGKRGRGWGAKAKGGRGASGHRHAVGHGAADHVRALGKADGFRALREGIAGITHHGAGGEAGRVGDGERVGEAERGTGGTQGSKVGAGVNGWEAHEAGRAGREGHAGPAGHADHAGHAGMTAPSVQAKPKDVDEAWRPDGGGRKEGHSDGTGAG